MHFILSLLHQSFTTYLEALLGLVAVSFLYTVGRALFDPLRKIPGPRWARFTRLWILKHFDQGDFQDQQIDLHKKYGPIVRVAPNEYSFNDLDAFSTIYAHGSKFAKSDWYYPFGNLGHGKAGIFQERDTKMHGEQRKRVANLYSLTNMLSYEPFVQQETDHFLSQLTRFAQEGKAFSVTDWMQFYAFDVIGAITVGNSFGFLKHGFDYQGILHEIHSSIIYANRVANFWPALHYYFMKLGPYLGCAPARIATTAYAARNIAMKRQQVDEGETTEERSGKQDFVEKMLGLEEKGKLDAGLLQIVVSANVNAGSDTTAISLSAILYFLLRHPDALARVRAEIQEHKDQGRISEPITFKEAQELQYFQAVVKESLRLHPAVGTTLPRVVPKGGATLGGQFFPAGTVVGVNSWVIHHNKDAFGPDADEFNPDRWLESKERSVAMEHYFFSFGGGARTCLGRNVSFLEINKLVPELVMRFDFELEDPKRAWDINNIFFTKQSYNCFVKEREIQG